MFPDKLKIGAHTYDVEMVSAYVGDDCGRVDNEKLKIVVREGMPYSSQWETLIHEVVHAYRMLAGVNLPNEEEEEKIVQAEGHLLYMFLKDNPKLLEELIAHNEIQTI